jgi:hypothetical protein
VNHASVVVDRSRRGRRAPWTSRLSVALVALLLLALSLVGAPAAAAGPAGPAMVLSAREPFGEYVDRLSFEVQAIDPALVTATGRPILTISGIMTNQGPEALTNLAYRFQRGSALATGDDVRAELDTPSEPADQVQDDFTAITTATDVSEIAAGASVPFIFTVSIVDDSGLAVDEPGVYPLMVNVNGAVVLEGGPLDARIGELHLLLTVMGVPGGTTEPAAAPEPAPDAGPAAQPLLVNFVWPLVDRPHLGVGGVFLNDDLLTAISPGGRLATLLDGLSETATERIPDGSLTVVVDPQLLDELDRMTRPYRIVDDPGEPQPSMTVMLQAEADAAVTSATTATPTPTGTAPPATAPTLGLGAIPGATGSGATPPAATASANATPEAPPAATSPAATSPALAASTPAEPADPAGTPPVTAGTPAGSAPGAVDIPGTVAGTGQDRAASYLERLRDVAARYPVLVLPYGDPDVVALTRSGLTGEVAATVQHGQQVAANVLGAAASGDDPAGPLLDVTTAYPINGAVDAATLQALTAAGLDTALLSESSIAFDAAADSAPGPSAAQVQGLDTPVPAAITQRDVLSGIGALIDQGRQSGWAMRVNALTGVLAAQSLDGSVAPAVFTPERRWSPDAPGLRVLTDLFGTLGSSQVISGVPLTTLATGASAVAATDYPEQAEQQELPPSYLDRIRGSRLEVQSLRQSLAATPQAADPALVLDPLDEALDAAASTAFRFDPAVGEANLATVESTTQGIRTGIRIAATGGSYTLASSSSPLLLTLQNDLPYDVPVRVHISGGEMVGLTVTDPGIQLIPAGGSQQVRIPAEVSRSGQFQVTAELVGEDGVVWGPPVQLSVVSTAYGALTVILIVVAGGVLVVMVALRIVQRVRDRRARLAREALGATDPTPATDPASAPLRDVIPAPPPVDQARTEQQR